MNTELLVTLTYYDMLKLIMDTYTKMYGEQKLSKVIQKVYTSDTLSGMISRSDYIKHPIEAKHIVLSLNKIPYFIFASGETQLLASFITLQRWNEDVNSKYNLIDVNDLKSRGVDIIHMLRGTI